jgi:hypothetical protein
LLAASLSIHIPVVAVFQNPTVRDLARLVTSEPHS